MAEEIKDKNEWLIDKIVNVLRKAVHNKDDTNVKVHVRKGEIILAIKTVKI